MAKSGTLNSGNYQGRYIQFSWTATQSVTDNTSTISWTLKGAGTGQSGYYESGAFKVIIDDATVYSTSESNRIKLWNGTEVASGTKTLTHKSDGTRTFKVYIEAGIYYYAVNCTGETTFTLDTIPRASTFKVSSTSADMNTAVTFTITRASTAFTHKLTYSFEGKTGTIGSDIATSKSWTIPLSLAAAIPSKTSGTATITLTTYNGSTAIGTKTLTMTLKVPSSVVPTISSVTITEATSGLADKFGAFIQNKSKLKVVISASGVQSSTIKSYSTKILSNPSKTYSGSTITSGLITSSGSVNVVVTVTDSRGRTATTTKTVTVLAYTDPKIILFTAQRCDSDGTLNDDGEYVQLVYAFQITSLNSKNDKTYSISYKLPSDSDYTSLTSGNEYTADTIYVPATLFDVDNSYEIKLTVKDYFKTVTYIVELSTAFTLVDYHSSGKGMSIGKVAELEGVFEVGLPIKLTGGMYSENKVLWSGGYYMNASQTATLSEKVSNQLFGIVLVFSRYDVSNSENLNEHFCYHFVPKEIVSLMPGKGSIFNMSTSNETYSASKYLYISDTEIKGHENNVAIGTGDTGVAYSNNRFVLRYVIGV